MIYTIGHRVSYDAALADGPMVKVGRYSEHDGYLSYAGGAVFKTVEAAVKYLVKCGLLGEYAVYAVDADWEQDTVAGDEPYHHLLEDAPVIRRVSPT